MRRGMKHALTLLLCSFIMVSMLVSCGSEGGGSVSGSNASLQNQVKGIWPSSNIHAQDPLSGTWKSGDQTLTFEDNTYSADFNHDGLPEAWGRITRSGNIMILTDSGGRNSCINNDAVQVVDGIYTYDVSGDTLTFGLFRDPCHSRAGFLGLTYTKQ